MEDKNFTHPEPIPVRLTDYVPDGGGATGDSFYLKDDPTVLLKLFHPGKTLQSLDEMRLSRMVYQLGIPTPEPGDYVVSEDGRRGIRYRRIIGKKSFSRAVSDDPGNVEKYAGEFAVMCRELHSVHLDTHITGHNLFVSAYHGFATPGNEQVPEPRAFEKFPPFAVEVGGASLVEGLLITGFGVYCCCVCP